MIVMLYAAIDTIITILECAYNIIDVESIAVANPGQWSSQCIDQWTDMITSGTAKLRAQGLV